MPDWKEVVKCNLAPRSVNEEVVAELAAHLEEVYEDARVRQSSETEASQLALEQVDDWHILAADIARAKSQEDSMNRRTKTILLPALAILFSVGLFLLFTDRAAILQRPIWIACMALLLYAVALEKNRLNLRTSSLWVPGFVSLTVASLLMFAEELVFMHDPSFYFTDLSLRPSHLLLGLPGLFYGIWLLIQVPCGALGAFLSRRGGGTRVARIISGAFPAIVTFGLCAVVIPVSALFERNAYVLQHPAGVALAVFIWAGAPAVALLAGAAPFLRETESLKSAA
jgi:hypothetical protein